MEKLEQEVFKYKKMAEREVDIFHKIVSELIAEHEKETAKLWGDILSLHDTTNKLQAQLYDVQNQNCEYENSFHATLARPTVVYMLISKLTVYASHNPWAAVPGTPSRRRSSYLQHLAPTSGNAACPGHPQL
ncbi:hypothetical protein QYE76_035776 [Lolium multiflorum]|uniref:Uncharacterized protein n=1 Tax=Lolium multiflorum TaxID=4521 RepID=A0AAD8R3M0_LOLMU|nr:hypothetical protein QYE76_035776 [Lolium multiflorum]